MIRLQDARSEAECLAIFGETVRQIRLSRGLTADQVAAQGGWEFSHADVNAIEAGTYDVTVETIYALAEALGVSPKVLVS